MIYTIESDNNITTFASAEEAKAAMRGDYEQFGSARALAKLASGWPATRLVAVWNSLPGVQAVKKFKDRPTGADRIWQALQGQRPHALPDGVLLAPPAATKKPQPGKQARAEQEAPSARQGSKSARILDLIQQPDGATLAAIMEATGWQPHSVRGFVSGTLGRKMGLRIESARREDGQRVYTLAK